MSTEIKQGADAGIASLPLGRQTVNLDQEKSAVRYLWFPHVSIPIVGGSGLKFRLGRDWSYYGVGIPGEPPEQYEARRGNMLMRCTAYPLWNIYYMESRFNQGNYSVEEQRNGNALGAATPMVTRQEFAGVCAEDFVRRYSAYGAEILHPFTGIEPEEGDGLVDEIFKIVQPRPLKLTNLRQERAGALDDEETLLFDLAERGPCVERIKGAKLNKEEAKMADDLRRVMLRGTRAAKATAVADWDDLSEQLSNTEKGHKGNKKGPSEYDMEVARLLGMPIPSVVAGRPAGDPEVGKALNLLTQIAAQGAQVQPGLITLTPEQLSEMVNKAVDERMAKKK